MFEDPFKYDDFSKEWYRSVYKIGRSLLFIFLVETILMIAMNSTVSMGSEILPSDSPLNRLYTEYLVPILNVLAPNHIVPVIVFDLICSAQFTDQNSLLMFILAGITMLLLSLHFISYLGSKRSWTWMQFESISFLVDTVFLVYYSNLSGSFGIKSILCAVIHLLWFMVLRYTSQCGKIAEQMEEQEETTAETARDHKS